MSDSQSPESRRAEEKAAQGRTLFVAGEYEAAIEACTAAIELDPSSADAHRTREEAFARLGGQNAYRGRQQHPSGVTGFSRMGKLGLLLSGVFWSGLAAFVIALIFSGVIGDYRGVYIEYPTVWLYILAGMGVFLGVVNAFNDIRGVFVATTQRTGAITRLLTTPAPILGEVEHRIDVDGAEFPVADASYAELSQGDRVTVVYRVALWGPDKVLAIVKHSAESEGASHANSPSLDRFTSSWAQMPWPLRVLLAIATFAFLMGGLMFLLYGSE